MKTYRIINLEDGMPTVADAMTALGREIRLAKRHGLAAVKLIHGFGSTGKGGKIRVAARRELEALQKRGYVKGVIPGEKLSIFDEDTRRAFARCPELRRDPDLERHNNGVTIVLL
ncbi:MAG: hypothetical protein J6L72_08445 [Butyricicoccus sp.]|nr:hypothetical protein [Butyricicoccus sp.]